MSTISTPVHPRATMATSASAPVRVLAPKSAGVAALLSLVWPGFGDLYADRLASGTILVLAHLAVCALTLAFFGLSSAGVAHVAVSGIVAIRVASHTNARNRRLFAWRL